MEKFKREQVNEIQSVGGIGTLTDHIDSSRLKKYGAFIVAASLSHLFGCNQLISGDKADESTPEIETKNDPQTAKPVHLKEEWRGRIVEIEGHCEFKIGGTSDWPEEESFFSGTRKTVMKCEDGNEIVLVEQFLEGKRNGDLVKKVGNETHRAFFKEGYLEGTARRYLESGITLAKADYENGRPNGSLVFWNDDGQVRAIYSYSKGRQLTAVELGERGGVEVLSLLLEGSWERAEYIYVDYSWHDKGKVLIHGSMYCGNPCGVFRHDSGGKTMREEQFVECPAVTIDYNGNGEWSTGIDGDAQRTCLASIQAGYDRGNAQPMVPMVLSCSGYWFGELEALTDCSNEKEIWEAVDHLRWR